MAHFADPAHWRSFYGRRSGASFEWYVDAAAALRAIAPRLTPRSHLLHAGCGTSELGSLLAARGHSVANIDFEPTVVAAARALHQRRIGSAAFTTGPPRWPVRPAPAAFVNRAAHHRPGVGSRATSEVHSAYRPGIACPSPAPAGHSTFHCHDLRQLPADWTGAFDAIIDKGGLCAAARNRGGGGFGCRERGATWQREAETQEKKCQGGR